MKPGDHVVLAGDFNPANVSWSTLSLKDPKYKSGVSMSDIAFTRDLLQDVETLQEHNVPLSRFLTYFSLVEILRLITTAKLFLAYPTTKQCYLLYLAFL